MTPERRTPRGFQQQPTTTDQGPDLPSVSPILVEWLEREFPIVLSKGAPADVIQDQAEQCGRQQVIERLRSLSNNQE